MKIAIIGAGGRLGAMLQREYRRTHAVTGFNHAELDLGNHAQIRRTLAETEFDLLINCAAQTNVDRCETAREEAFALNAEAPGLLAEICATKGARLIHISTDYVFDGEKQEPYTEADEPNPISIYGASKLEGERRVLATDEQHLVVRVSWVFGPDRPSFVDWIVARAREQDAVEAVADKYSTPTCTLDLAEMLRPFLAQSSGVSGLLHLANHGHCSWREYGQWALDCCVADGMPLRAKRVGAISLAEMRNFVARRPIRTALSTAKYEQLTGQQPRDWREAVAEYVRQYLCK